MRPRDETKRAAILAAALDQVGALGLPALSMDAVAHRAHVAVGTVYVYFAGKESLIEGVYGEVKARFGASLSLRSKDATPVRQAFEKICRRYFTYCLEHPTELAFLEQVELMPTYREKVRALDAGAIAPLVALLERGQAERIIKPVAASLLIAFLAGALRFSASAVAGKNKAVRAQITTQLIAVCWDAVAA